MPVKRGSVYLANFNPAKGTESGKIRPCLVMQSDLLNEAGHLSTTVLPLTTLLLDDAAPLRYRLNARDQLLQNSDIMVDQTRTIDNRRFTHELLTELNGKELAEVETYWRIVMELD